MDDTQTIGEFISPFWMFPRAVFLHTGIGFKGWLQEKLRLLVFNWKKLTHEAGALLFLPTFWCKYRVFSLLFYFFSLLFCLLNSMKFSLKAKHLFPAGWLQDQPKVCFDTVILPSSAIFFISRRRRLGLLILFLVQISPRNISPVEIFSKREGKYLYRETSATEGWHHLFEEDLSDRIWDKMKTAFMACEKRPKCRHANLWVLIR